MPTQMRRYELDPAHVEQWLSFFQELTVVRSKFGFRLLSAYFDRTNNEFTWIVQHDQPFGEVEPAYTASAERAALFAGRPAFARALHVSEVEEILVG